MNDSTSATSPVWPTRWPKDSFKGFATWLVAGFITLIFLGLFVLSLTGNASEPNVDPLEFALLIAFQFLLEGVLVAIVILHVARPSRSSALRSWDFGCQPGRTWESLFWERSSW